MRRSHWVDNTSAVTDYKLNGLPNGKLHARKYAFFRCFAAAYAVIRCLCVSVCDVYVGGKVRVSEFMIFLDLQHCGSK